VIDVDGLLAEISPDAPCGEDLEYGAVAELSRAAEVKAEQQIGDTVVPAEEPDWEQLRRSALKLFDQTKDLRVAVILVNACARTQGWPGFRDAVQLLDGLLERYWVDVHPQLDEDEPNDFTMRVNLIASLGDAETTLGYLRDAPLVESVMQVFPARLFDRRG
jgi:type VI secretion system protein ImpA